MTITRSRQISHHRVLICAVATLLIALAAVIATLEIVISAVEKWRQEATIICTPRPRWYEQADAGTQCPAGRVQLKQRLKLLTDLSAALNKTDSLHWLCYGTLWGVLRGNTLLDYDKDGDICVLGIAEELMEKVIEGMDGGDIRYSKNFTTFHVWRDLAEVEITLYEITSILNDDTNDRKVLRAGWQTDFVARDCVVEYFPSRYIEPPLPHQKLNEVWFPVPREGFEIQMYLYPLDWHKVVKPAGCR